MTVRPPIGEQEFAAAVIGSTEADDDIQASTLTAMHGLLDAPGTPPLEVLPPLWHWLAFRPAVAHHALGADGHPRLVLSTADGPPLRRMWASGSLSFEGSLRPTGLHRSSRVAAVERKTGRSGAIIFVNVEHRVTSASGSITERQVLAYRLPADTPGAVAIQQTRRAESGGWPWQLSVDITETLLFRFSALTYNAHRIHYDRQYARDVEGYHGLVVHGPLQAVLLAELARRHAPERRVASFDFRSVAPAFDDGPLLVRARPTSSTGWELEAIASSGYVSMTAALRFGA